MEDLRVWLSNARLPVFDSDPYVEAGADENGKDTLMAQGVATLRGN